MSISPVAKDSPSTIHKPSIETNQPKAPNPKMDKCVGVIFEKKLNETYIKTEEFLSKKVDKRANISKLRGISLEEVLFMYC